jgi:hypothetical protein
MTDFTAFPIANVTIPSLPDLGGVTDASMLVGERAGTGRFAATALRSYATSKQARERSPETSKLTAHCRSKRR